MIAGVLRARRAPRAARLRGRIFHQAGRLPARAIRGRVQEVDLLAVALVDVRALRAFVAAELIAARPLPISKGLCPPAVPACLPAFQNVMGNAATFCNFL